MDDSQVLIIVLIVGAIFGLAYFTIKSRQRENQTTIGLMSMPNTTKPPTTSSSNISSSSHADIVKLVMNDPAVNVALQRGNKIEAIRLVRIATGLGLKESKDLVEQHLSGVSVGNIAPPPPMDAAAVLKDQELVWLMERGNKIGAIKRYRELTGVGLKEAKDAVEQHFGR